LQQRDEEKEKKSYQLFRAFDRESSYREGWSNINFFDFFRNVPKGTFPVFCKWSRGRIFW